MEESEIKALISLLEDEDHNVLNHVESKIISLGSDIIPHLEREWESNFNPDVQKRIEDLIHQLQFDLLKERMVEWKESETQDLLEGMWLVATYQYPDLTMEKLKQDIEQVYQEAWRSFKPDLHPFDQIKVLNGALFSSLRFSANTKNFHSPGNSMINMVLESRKGNPISLCVIYMLIAEKLELPVFGVNLPKLFILTYKADNHPQFYINAFNRGLIFLKEDIDNYIGELGLNPVDDYYQPCTNLDIIKRVLRNLSNSYEHVGDHSKCDEVKILLQALSDSGMISF